jgi:hypothetical protein
MTVRWADPAHIGSIPHELGHMLGLSHENDRNGVVNPQNDEERGADDVTWSNTNPIPRMCPVSGQPSAWSIKSAKTKNEPFGPYDIWSIMHYPFKQNLYQWNCGTASAQAYLRQESNKDPLFWTVTAFNDGATIDRINLPSREEVELRTWSPSWGDVLTIRHMYPGPKKDDK